MYLRFTREEETFRQEVRDFLKRELPLGWDGMTKHEFCSDEGWAFYRDFTRKVAGKGWLQMHWPVEYGGQGASPMKMTVFVEEMAYHQAPMIPEAGWIGPTIIMYGDEEHKKKYLPGTAAGEIEWCIAYSEPGAGSDLFSLKTKAEEDGDSFVINGQKIYTSFAHKADYCFLAARTDSDKPKHFGISIFIVDMKTPGITVRPLLDMGGSHAFNEVFFDNVRVPMDCLIGKKNDGLSIIITELDLERASGAGADMAGRSQRFLEKLIAYAGETNHRGEPLSNDPMIRQALVEREVEIEVTRLLAYRVVWLLTKGIVAQAEASVSKVYGNEMQHRLAKTGLELLGMYGTLQDDPKRSRLIKEVWDMCLFSFSWLFAGGTNEIQKNIIAMRGLGLPKVQV
ncbi:MAG: acyl-CoA dehydrogenase family protein [Chloroflexota bacterium]|nr:acyl-CoA dehydrogenase family protein [Chloroflexota bacterium]